jgi:DNA-binding SARP family transcriptional activator
LSVLNQVLGEWLEIDRETVSLKPDADVWVDVSHFRRLVANCPPPPDLDCSACLAPLAEAATLYRDDFLAGFTLRDSPDFDEWQFFQSESLRRDLAGALERLAACYSAQQAFEPAIAYARRWLSLDPLHEPAHRQLMQLYAWSNQRAASRRRILCMAGGAYYIRLSNPP